MDKLNDDIIQIIFDEIKKLHAEEDELCYGAYATISHQWQRMVEWHTLREVNVCALCPDTGVLMFRRVFFSSPSAERRRSCLRIVHLTGPFKKVPATEEELVENAGVLHLALVSMLEMLRHWDKVAQAAVQRGRTGDGEGQEVGRYAADGSLLRPAQPLRLNIPWGRWSVGECILAVRCETPRLYLLAPGGHVATNSPDNTNGVHAPYQKALWVPQLQSFGDITEVDAENFGSLPLGPLGELENPAWFSRLQDLKMAAQDPGHAHPQLRRLRHNQLAQAIESMATSLPNLRSLFLEFEGFYAPQNHSWRCPDLTDEQGIYPLCEALRRLAQGSAGGGHGPGLKRMELERVPISSDLFLDCRRRGQQQGTRKKAGSEATTGPNEDEDDNTPGYRGEEPNWPLLEVLYIRTELVAPSGEWYYYWGQPDDPHSSRHPPSSSSDSEEEEEEDDDVGSDNQENTEAGDPQEETSSEEQSNDEWDDERSRSSLEDDDEDEPEEPWNSPIHHWRGQPDPEMFNPLALDMATAVTHMPRLHMADLCLVWREGWPYSVRDMAFECAAEGCYYPHTYNREKRLLGPPPDFRRWRMCVEEKIRWDVPDELKKVTQAWTKKDPVTLDVD